MEHDYIEMPGFKLSYSRTNFQNNAEFSADTWPVALSNFIRFLRGAGYVIGNDVVQINGVDAETYAQDFE